MKIRLETKTTAIQWRFEKARVASFEIEEKFGDDWVATAKGKNMGAKGIMWQVELHSCHTLWKQYKETLWDRLTGLVSFRDSADKNGWTHRETVIDETAIQKCTPELSEKFEKHFELWHGNTWKAPPLACDPAHADTTDIPFEGLFPLRTSPARFVNQKKKSKKADIANPFFDDSDHIPAEFPEKKFTDEVLDEFRERLHRGTLTHEESQNLFNDLYAGGAIWPIDDALHVEELLSSFVSHLHLDAQRFPPDGTLSKNRLSSSKSSHQPWLRLLDDDFSHAFYSQFRFDLGYFRSCYSIPDEIAAEMVSAQENHKFRKEWPGLIQKLVAAGVEKSNINNLYVHVVQSLFEKVAKSDLSPILAATEGLRQIGIQYRLEMRKHVTRMYPPGMDPRNDAEASDCKTLDTWDTELVFTRKSVVHTIHNLGSGVRVIVPVIVALVTAEAELLSIEEPECHVHPKLQAELGDLLIQRVGWTFCASLKYDPNYIANLDDQDDLLSYLDSLDQRNSSNTLVETHSEHLILRILRRIRETTEGEMDDWPESLRKACPNGIRPEDVSVLYVNPPPEGANEGSTVIVLPITPDGDFSKPWPGGFFAERDNELF